MVKYARDPDNATKACKVGHVAAAEGSLEDSLQKRMGAFRLRMSTAIDNHHMEWLLAI
jgi:hypothetical protein